MTSIRIRDAVPADVSTLADFNAAMALETEGKRLAREVLEPGIAGVFADPRRGFYLIAEAEGAVAGALLVTYEWSDWRNGDWWWIQSVYVPAAFRRRGVYRALHQAVEARARATPGVVGLRLYVEWENADAQRTYEAQGMSRAHYHFYQRSFIPLD